MLSIRKHSLTYSFLLQTRMQVIGPSGASAYSSLIQGTYRMAASEGVASLWRGMSSVVVGAGSFLHNPPPPPDLARDRP